MFVEPYSNFLVGRLMGVEYSLVCWRHREKLRLYKLREQYDAVEYFRSHLKAKIPKWLPEEFRKLLQSIKRFQERHGGCSLDLINDHMDLEDTLFIDVNWGKPVPTKEEFVKFAEERAVPIFHGSEEGYTIEYFVMSYLARKLGAKSRVVKVTFQEEVIIEPDVVDVINEFNPSYHIYDGEDGEEYHVFVETGGVAIADKTGICVLCTQIKAGEPLKGATTIPLWVCNDCIEKYGKEQITEDILDRI